MLNMGKMLKQVQKLQEDMARIQEELRAERVEGTGGGAVRVVANGHGEFQEVHIDPAAVDPSDVGMLEDLVLAAANDAHRKAKDLSAQRMKEATAGLPIPPGMLGL